MRDGDGDGDGHLFHDRRKEGRRHAPTTALQIKCLTLPQGKVNYPTLEGDIGEYHPGEYSQSQGERHSRAVIGQS